MEGHIRWIYDWLREYGATDLVLEAGGKHQKLRFVFQGKKHWYLVPHTPSTDTHALHNNRARLRRLLGPPATSIEKSHRTLEEMMDELNKKTELNVLNTTLSVVPSSYPKPLGKTWQGTVAAYKTASVPLGAQLYIVMPADVVESLPSGFRVTRLDDEHWKLASGGRTSWQINSTNTRKCVCVNRDITVPFAASPAEMVLVDGEILVHQAKEDRIAPGKAPAVKAPAVKAPAVKAPALINTTEMETQMREIIRQVQVLETLCPYRLVRLESNRLIWRAPTIE